MSKPNVYVCDGIADPGATLYHVSHGGTVTEFVLLREDEATEFPNDRYLVAVGRGLHLPLYCYGDRKRADARAMQLRAAIRERARRDLSELGEPVG